MALTLPSRDMSALLIPSELGWAWIGCVLLARRRSHPMGPLLYLLGLAVAVAVIPFAYARYTPVLAPVLILAFACGLSAAVAAVAHAVALRQALDASRAALVTAREEERRRLRRDLHDGVGPTLAALALGLETACMLPAGCRQQEDLLDSLQAETQQAVTDIRRIVYGLRPPALDELGLAAALHEEAARLERQPSGPSIAVHIPGGDLDRLPAAVEVAAYRIITEAVTNVVRHACAHRCQVRIRHGQNLSLEVCDDGAGLPDGWRAGVGITAMRERAAELGGELTIEPASPRGTRITARLPIRTPQ